MRKRTRTLGLLALCLLIFSAGAAAQTRRGGRSGGGEAEFGPNVRAYLGYLRTEQEVVDDRASRREIDRRYYIHNSNRIQALRQMALRIARASGNDYLPELEAFTQDEFAQFFEEPPKPAELQEGGVHEFKFRYLGTVLSGREKFYLFARLDPYEQAELRKKTEASPQTPADAAPTPAVNAAAQPAVGADTAVRPRRAVTPSNQNPPNP